MSDLIVPSLSSETLLHVPVEKNCVINEPVKEEFTQRIRRLKSMPNPTGFKALKCSDENDPTSILRRNLLKKVLNAEKEVPPVVLHKNSLSATTSGTLSVCTMVPKFDLDSQQQIQSTSTMDNTVATSIPAGEVTNSEYSDLKAINSLPCDFSGEISVKDDSKRNKKAQENLTVELLSDLHCSKKSSSVHETGPKIAGSTKIINFTWLLGAKIGSGSFGDIHVGWNITNGLPVAIKLENRFLDDPQLQREYKICKILQHDDHNFTPRVHFCKAEKEHVVMVMDILGASLGDLFGMCKNKFSTKTICFLADGMLAAVEKCHKKGFIHRDLKPENFLIGRGVSMNRRKISLIDYGLATRYLSFDSKSHLPLKVSDEVVGTLRYASLNMHKGLNQSRRDDLESLGYILIYFANGGKLPWQGLKNLNDNRDRSEAIGEIKFSTTLNVLCSSIQEEFLEYMAYVRSLKFDETPNYSYLRSIFFRLSLKFGSSDSYMLDWENLEFEKDLPPVPVQFRKRNSLPDINYLTRAKTCQASLLQERNFEMKQFKMEHVAQVNQFSDFKTHELNTDIHESSSRLYLTNGAPNILSPISSVDSEFTAKEFLFIKHDQLIKEQIRGAEKNNFCETRNTLKYEPSEINESVNFHDENCSYKIPELEHKKNNFSSCCIIM